jgi:Tfp pilus assembly pilus retraction ATPase PilT
VLASEILIANQAVSSLIREAKTHQTFSTVQTDGRERMKSFNQTFRAWWPRGNQHRGRVAQLL